MTRNSGRLVASLWLASAIAASAHSAELEFADIEGWWSAEPRYANDSARVVLHFVSHEGKQTLRLSLPSIGAYDIPAGSVIVKGDRVTTDALEFPLTYNAQSNTLNGVLPEAIVPVHKIPVAFKRSESLTKPAARTWDVPQPRIKWRANVHAPVWAGLERDDRTGLLFVATDAGALHAVDDDGRTRWQFDTRHSIKARPALIGRNVYIHSDSGYAYKLDAQTGKEQWRAKIDVGSPARIPVHEPKTRWDRYGSSFVADAQNVYVGSRDNHLYALDIETGKERWRVSTRDMITATPALRGDTVVFGSFDGSVRAVKTEDGTERWSYDARLPVSGDVVIAGDRVLAGSRTYDLIALDANSGKEAWKQYYWFSWIESPPVVRHGIVYTGSSDATECSRPIFAMGSDAGKPTCPATLGHEWLSTIEPSLQQR